MANYAIGLDFGTNSCRSVIINVDNGDELSTSVYNYPSGELGIITDKSDPNVARQNPQDYIQGLEQIIKESLAEASNSFSDFNSDQIIGIGVDTTGSTPIPVDDKCRPLSLNDEFKENINAMVWLWKDHTSHEEAEEITKLANDERPQYLERCGGTYSSEWWWSKILHLKRIAPDVYEATYTFIEHCDYIPALLSGITDPNLIKRSVCAAGHKAMFSESWGGLPDKEFLGLLDPDLPALRDRMYEAAFPSNQIAGRLSLEWSEKTGLRKGVPIAVGAFDCHMGAVACGVKEGVFTKILGTSTCDITVVPESKNTDHIPGVCGVVNGSVLPNHYGIEAGQSAVGDIFLWLVNNIVPDSYGNNIDEKFEAMEIMMANDPPGSSGLLALDWNNGNRTILVDVRLSGLLIGQTLHTRAHEVYRAYIEATAFGALTIINRVEEYGVKIKEIVTTGGLAVKNTTLMQIYADILDRPLKVAKSDQTCAVGAALFGASVNEEYDIFELRDKCSKVRDLVYQPNHSAVKIYKRLFSLYQDLHDSFGNKKCDADLSRIMKELIDIREDQR
ncbi:MAG: ribulokinase [Verrucomicrobia bacterium]|nr:MAG: ribulokinase [Verrucomicrobiota bacterium]|tara:strand:+ start:60 stop:1739 length:1680 start_codon:yes stop_codon:yes gene_type:complete